MTVVDDIKSRVDILEVVSRYVPLQRSGRSNKANCPFHQEKTPSFFVFPDRQTWRCFGACATGGDVFSFVMRAENLEFGDALKSLAQQAGVTLPNEQRRSQMQVAVAINESARSYYQDYLASSQGAGARAYLDQRGLSRETTERFELGLSPRDGESLRDHLVRQGYSTQQLNQAGIVRTSENGWQHDMFRGRLMFPIRDGQGELGGFGGRILPVQEGDDSQPKYLNSARSSSFDKGSILYALYLAKDAVRQQGIVIVEGYMDAIAAHQEGFTNVVASMGTALTENQVAEIRRLTADVTMALDQDAAGQQATLRSMESSWRVFQSRVAGRSQGTTLFQRQDMLNLKIAVLPEGMDPDDVIKKSPQEWTNLIEGGMPLMEYLFNALSAQFDPTTPQGKTRLVEAMFPLIAAVPEPAQQDYYFQKLADLLGVTQETLQASVGRPTSAGRSRSRGTASPGRQATPSAFARLEGDPLEEYCLALLMSHPELEEEVEDLRPEYFQRMENREIYNQWVRVCQGRQDEAEPASLRGLVDEELAQPLEALLQKSLPPLDSQHRADAMRDSVRLLETRFLREVKAEEEIRFSEAPPDLDEDPPLEVLEVNQRIKQNQSKRNSVLQDSTFRGN